MRALLPLAFYVAFSIPAAAGEDMPDRPVDLDRPGVLERLARQDPDRYAAVRDILEVSARFPCQESALCTLQARYDLPVAACGAPLLTSYPAQRNLRFRLKGTLYAARVTVRTAERIEPASVQ